MKRVVNMTHNRLVAGSSPAGATRYSKGWREISGPFVFIGGTRGVFIDVKSLHPMIGELHISHPPVPRCYCSVAIFNNESLEALFEFYRRMLPTRKSFTTLPHSLMRLSLISPISIPHSITHTGSQPQVTISSKYKSITWNHRIAGIVVTALGVY